MTVAAEQHIETTPNVCGGRPRVSGTRIRVADVAVMHLRMGMSVSGMAAPYALTMAGLHAAMAHDFDHQAEIDTSIEDDEAFAAAFQRG